ncbi:MAG: hypothetical protein P8Z30_10100 [Acidobacteriota bacterium]
MCATTSKGSLLRAAVCAALCAAALAAGSVRCDARKKPVQTWAVAVLRAKPPYRVRSTTTLGGGTPLGNAQMVTIASGAFRNWQWAVKAYPTLLPSWRAWLTSRKARKWLKTPDSWSHPAPNWQQGFERSYKVVAYLLGREPVPLRATILLVPEGTSYHKTITQQAANYAPMTLAFYYPASSSHSGHAQLMGWAALVEALSYTVYEYEQVVLATDAARKALGRSRVDRLFSNTALGMCWAESAALALQTGQHAYMEFNPRMVVSKRPSSGAQFGPSGRAKGSKASEQAASRFVERYNSYVRDLGLHKQKVSQRDPKAMNRVLNFYRAITAYYLDLADGRQPPSHVQFTPFFPPAGG